MDAKQKAIQAALAKRQKRKSTSTKDLAAQILDGDRVALAKGITLIESENTNDQVQAGELINLCQNHKNKSFRLGITGVPGVGKSSFIESFGLELVKQKHKVAVLAIDPSSGINKGSILGDKTRMNELSRNPNVFIRPSPNTESLGGVARKTREALSLCEAAGYDFIIIETVGVGQSEVAVKDMCDFFLLLMLAGAGDELQGIKRGIMEMADALLITKADTDNENKARQASLEYRRALHLFPAKQNNWSCYVSTVSSLKNTGLKEFYQKLQEYQTKYQDDYIPQLRQNQDQIWFKRTVEELWLKKLYDQKNLQEIIALRKEIADGNEHPIRAAQKLINKINA